jgi:broad specificity phosphatase PhoE
MKVEFPDVDFETVDPVWPDKTTPAGRRYAYTRTAILARGKHCLEELSRRPEKLVLVISHSGFLRVGVTGYWWMNADYRIFDFEDAASGELRLRQDETTLSGGLGLSWKGPVELGSDLPEEDPDAATEEP